MVLFLFLFNLSNASLRLGVYHGFASYIYDQNEFKKLIMNPYYMNI
jgi:hypothetical protein